MIVCTTLHMDHKNQRRWLTEQPRLKTINNHVKGKNYKTISKQLHVPVTTTGVHGTKANLPGREGKRKNKHPKIFKLNSKVKVSHFLMAMMGYMKEEPGGLNY